MSFLCYVGRHWYAATSVVLSLCFVAIASLWVNLIPVFQSPDEPAHFDYAYALATAGTLLRAADGPPGYDPRVRTAMRAADLDRIAFNVNERVSRAYANRAYRTTVRLKNEAFRSYSPRDPHAVRPGLASVYPFVPYAIYALAARPFRGDVFSALYACRFASVAFSAIGILLWSRILRRLRVDPVHALALVAIVAFFPLTSFVGSYVQPDGVAFALVSAIFLVTLRIRDGRTDIGHGVSYAVLLSALYGSKLQFAFAVGIATIGTILFAYARARVHRGIRAIVGATIFACLTIVYGTTHWVMEGGGSTTYFEGRRTLTSALSDHARSGELAYLFDESRLAIFDLFGAGTSARSFWGYFGWLDTPLRVADYRLTDAFTLAEIVGTVAIAFALAITTGAIFSRFVTVARKRAWISALRLGTNDPVFNAYLIFASLIVTLYVTSGNVFRAQGRDWYAFEVIAFASGTWYASRVLPRRLRRFGSTIVLASLAICASVSAEFAVSTIEDRYYRPLAGTHHPDISHLTASENAGGVTIDDITKKATRMTVDGWAYDVGAGQPCRAMYATIDDRFAHWIAYGTVRDDVGRAFDRFDLAGTGFHDVVDYRSLRPGRHVVAITCVSASGTRKFDPTSVDDVTIAR